MRGDDSSAVVMMVLLTAIGLFSIPLLPWMTMVSDAEWDYTLWDEREQGDSSVTGHMSEANVYDHNGSEEAENLENDITWIGYAYWGMFALSLTALLGVLLEGNGFGPTVGYIGGGALVMAIIIIILHAMLFIHIAQYNDAYSIDIDDSSGGDYVRVKVYYTIGLNLIPLACAVLMILFSYRHIRSLG